MGGLPRTVDEIVDDLLAKAIPVGECLQCHLRPSVDRGGRKRQYVSVGGRNGYKIGAPKLVYSTKKGPVKDGLWVLHTCDNMECINLEHLFLGTPKDNTNDMIEKGRAQFVNPRTDHIYRDDIMKLHKQGLSRFEIAEKLYISPNTVWNYISPKGTYYVGE